MSNPSDFDRKFGVLNIGFMVITTVYTFIGFFGYLKWGEGVEGTLTLNLPADSVFVQPQTILFIEKSFLNFILSILQNDTDG